MKRAFLKLSAAACAVLIAGPALASSPIELIVDYPFPELFRDVHTEIASEFMARNPNIKITFRAPTPGYEEATQQTLRQAVTKQLPDIAFHGLNRQRIFSDRDLAVDLQPFIRKEANWARMGYDQALLSLGQVGLARCARHRQAPMAFMSSGTSPETGCGRRLCSPTAVACCRATKRQ